MDKYLVSEIPHNQQVIIDVPEGYLRVAGYVDKDTGDGRMVFTRATKFAETGTEVASEKDNIPLLQMHIQTPERAMVIAQAFIQLANSMGAWAEEDDPVVFVDEYDGQERSCYDIDCLDCPDWATCYGKDKEEDNNG